MHQLITSPSFPSRTKEFPSPTHPLRPSLCASSFTVSKPQSLNLLPTKITIMEPETVATSFEKDACKTKDNAPKGKTRSSSLLTISSGFTFLAALPGGSSSSSSFRSSSFR
ncbi:hypothetical protein NW756_000402 [Fusarium oxysporum]|nr:hypothetical protein NW763_006451 [Fusarium oxysporum]KAJ4062880.1 hypothetical protein NW753_004351 [Fusarium oxysporum]KAJ4104639.1 hypothetical protein NW756_000402 [Fusarium oxysporum]